MSGQIKYTRMCGACGPAVTARAKCTAEYGNEWAYDGFGPCDMCRWGWLNWTIGTKAKCKHVSYLGSPTDCCLGRDTGKNSCDPDYRPGSAACDSALAAYCRVGDRMNSDNRCIQWGNVRPEGSRQIKSEYCLANLGVKECQTWCKNETVAGRGTCDNAMTNYCKGAGANSAICSCINSKLADPNIGINPKCIDSNCIRSGYITQNMYNTNCPNITNCDVQMDIINTGILTANFDVNQECGQTNAPNRDTPSETPLLKREVLGIQLQWLLLIIFIIFVAIMMILAVVTTDTGSEL